MLKKLRISGMLQTHNKQTSGYFLYIVRDSFMDNSRHPGEGGHERSGSVPWRLGGRPTWADPPHNCNTEMGTNFTLWRYKSTHNRRFHGASSEPVDCCQNIDDELSEDVSRTSPWCWRPARLFAVVSQWEAADADADVVALFTNITASALRLRIFALCSCAFARRHAILLFRNSSGSVACESCRPDDWWFWCSIWCWSSWSRIWCISLLFSTALWFRCCCCCCCCCGGEELFPLLSLLSVAMEDVSCWSSLSELHPSSFNCSAASIDFRCIPAQSKQILQLKWGKYELTVTEHIHYGSAACQTRKVSTTGFVH